MKWFNDHLKYIVKKSCYSTLDNVDKIIGEKSVDKFANLWTGEKEAVMLMITYIEYEFIGKGNYTKDELAATRQTLGKVGKFFKDCRQSQEIRETLAVIQAKKK